VRATRVPPIGQPGAAHRDGAALTST
jgi:sulfate transport system ATP-binding protein